MIAIKEIQAWVASLNPDNYVAVDGGGLSLVALDENGKPTGAYLEIGGVPQIEDEN
jgi:hypothetical protein